VKSRLLDLGVTVLLFGAMTLGLLLPAGAVGVR
jgi:hypothetical protein